MEKLKLFVVDDHKLFVEGVVSLLSDEPEFEVAGYALSGAEFLAKEDKIEADVYLIDINMPGISGIELTRRLREIKPEARILILTMYDDFKYVGMLVKSGASGYVLKSANLQELTRAIQMVGQGHKYFGQEIQDVMFSRLEGDHPEDEKFPDGQGRAKLTKREVEILSLIAREYSTRQIAEKLFISERTVETHRKNILSKTNAKTVVGLSKYAIRQGIIKPDE
ncbi:MAG TPA: response regulator transcription factor [Bacteroidales bacterium]|nr:response regulator transcription factor [Bacteroidales bacterium]HSA42384.1 response regulator transcription factor [Bacteroidales bacterium]